MVKLSLVRSTDSGLETIQELSPTFTYPIFGEAERIFGYKGLSIDISYAEHDGSPHVDISYDKKFSKIGSTEASNLNKTLKQFLPASAFEREYGDGLKSSSKDWKPPGELVREYSKKGRNYEIWAGSLLDPAINQLVDNIQSLILFYVEAGSQLNLKEVSWSLDRWRIYFTFEKVTSPAPGASAYSFIGYCTTYRFWRFPFLKRASKGTLLTDMSKQDYSTKQLESRMRISQFLLLPPYQAKGHGSQLYQAVYNEVISDETLSELTVEDPSEEFDQLRDSCDWKVLEPQFRDAKIVIDADKPRNSKRIQYVPTAHLIPTQKLKEIRMKNKIAPRQFGRLLELYLLSLIPFSHRSAGGVNMTKIKIQKHTNKDNADRKYYWFRILMKQRIYRQNRETLRDADADEKYSAIENTANGQEDELEGLLMLFALRQASAGETVEEISGSSSKKRKVIEDDDDDDENEVVEELEVSMPKRPKV